MAANYVLLEKITVGAAGVASVTFNSIPQTGYTDLKLVLSARDTASGVAQNGKIKINGTTTGYSGKYLMGTGAAANSGSWADGTLGAYPSAGATANTFGNMEWYFPNYTSSNYKSFSCESGSENNGTTGYNWMDGMLWSNTAAITSITVPAITAFAQYSTFYLYGLAAVGATPAIAPYATGGDIVQTDGTYWYHAFLSSGSFTPKKALSCDVLVVAGGGGGGAWNAGGGGAGGVTAFTSQALISGTSYTTTVGAGGAASTASGTKGTNGASSQFGSLTAVVGGGGGGSDSALTGLNGASGGGAAGTSSGGSPAGGSGSNGYAGGSGYVGAPYSGGGGGGFTAVGANGSGSGGGAGGAGTNAYASSYLTPVSLGVSGYIAGGGGGGAYTGASGGAGGAGGGGTGGYNGPSSGTAATSAVANTGSGGGGGTFSPTSGGNGGSGIVIVRYAI